MKIISRYIVKTLFNYTMAVLVILLGIYGFFSFLAQTPQLGEKDYHLLDILYYTLLKLPGHLYELAPVIALIGSILGLGALAKNSEIIVLRSIGLAMPYFVRQTLKAGTIFIVIALLVGELLAPKLDHIADIHKAKALQTDISAINKQGVWLKQGHLFIHIGHHFDNQLTDVSLFDTTDFSKLKQITYSPSVAYNNKQLLLDNVSHYQITAKDKQKTTLAHTLSKSKTINNTLSPHAIQTINLSPRELSLFALYHQINFLDNNQLNSTPYQLEFYKRALMPLTLYVMLLLALPFVFGSLRDNSLGKKIFFGITVSIVFQLLQRLSTQGAAFFHYDPLLSNLAPIFLVAIFASLLLKKIAKQ